MTKEVLTLALEALELAGGNLCEALHHPKKLQHGIGQPCPAVAKYDIAITAIKEALAESKQEPVATVTSETGDPDITMSWWHEPALPVGTPLYTTPPQPKEPEQVSPMSEPNRAIAYAASGKLHELGYRYLNGEWVQPKEPEQEPVAWHEGESIYWHTNPALNDWIRANGTPLYTTPPQRKPLPREVIDRDFHGRVDFVRQVEAAHNIKE